MDRVYTGDAFINNNNNDDVTYIAQIRQGRKCAATCQCQTGMFSVDFWKWPQICQFLFYVSVCVTLEFSAVQYKTYNTSYVACLTICSPIAVCCNCLTQVLCVVQNQPFLKLLSMLVELAGGPPGMPPFMNYVLQKFWEVRVTSVLSFLFQKNLSLLPALPLKQRHICFKSEEHMMLLLIGTKSWDISELFQRHTPTCFA